MSPRRWTIWTMAALLLAGPISAQQPGTVEIGGFGQWTWFDDNAGGLDAVPEDGIGYGGRLGIFLTPNWQIEGDGYYSPQDRKPTEEFCCLGRFPTEVNASAFALRLNYNVPLGLMDGRSHLIIGAGAVRTNYAFEGGNSSEPSVANFGGSGLVGLRAGLTDHVALRFDGVADYMPGHEPEANLNLHARAGLSLLLGGTERVVQPAAPPPPPPAQPARPATPEPPAEERIRVCVIDPAAPGGIRTVDALYLPSTADTLVVVDGQRRPLAQTLPTVTLATDADWIMRGEPLTIRTSPTLELEYNTWQAGREIDAGELAYLGTVRDVPVYASAGDVAAVRTDLQTLRQQRATHDLDVLLRDRADLWNTLMDVQYLYVPLRSTGCVFQAMRLAETAIKQ